MNAVQTAAVLLEDDDEKQFVLRQDVEWLIVLPFDGLDYYWLQNAEFQQEGRWVGDVKEATKYSTQELANKTRKRAGIYAGNVRLRAVLT